jgi:hypothetical protein
MKRVLFLVGLAAMALCCCVEKRARNVSTGPLLHLHWAGAATLNDRAEGPTNLQHALALPATIELRNELFGKLGRTELRNSFQRGTGLPPGAGDASAFLRPLLEDLWNNESLLELRGDSARPDVIVAVQGDHKRAELWSTNLRQVANAWKLGQPVAASSNSWSAKAPQGRAPAAAVHYARSGKWILAAFGHSGTNPLEAMVKSDPVPPLESAIADFRADGPRLNECWPLLAKYQLPALEMKVMPRGQSLRTEGKLRYSERLPIKFEAWKIPTNFIFEPVISFTCGQGIAPLWSQLKGFSNLRLKNPPNQFTMWGLGTVHVQTFFAVPMPNATNVVKELAPRLPELVYTYFSNAPANFVWISNRAEWIWGGLPIIAPHIHPEKTADGEFLFAGLFPMGPRTNPAPPELFAQVTARTNLVYYDWELSQERLPHARHTFQLLDIINGRQLSPFSSASQRWMTNLPPCLGNTITEVTLTSPKELAFVRKSDLGFTGFELAWLARWFESPDFPIRYQPPPPRGLPLTNRPPASVTNLQHAPATNRPTSGTNAAPAVKK